MSSLHELENEIIQAEAKVNALREELHQQKQTERLQAVALIKEHIKLFQLSATDLGFSEKKAFASKKLAKISKGTAVAPKYSDPANGKTWSGRGRTPNWLAKYLLDGKSKNDFLI
jgi:DNA-binding protein H-NS